MTDLDAVCTGIGLGECGERGGQDVEVGLGAVRTDQFGAHLQKLSLVTLSALDRAEHTLAVIQANGQRRIVQTGRSDARHRRGVVRTDHTDAARAVDHLQHAFLRMRRIGLIEHIIKLDRRRDDLGITLIFERTADRVLCSAERACGLEQQITGALRSGNRISHKAEISFIALSC